MSARRVGPSPLLATSNSAPATGALYGAILHVPLGIPRVAAAPRPATSATSATSATTTSAIAATRKALGAIHHQMRAIGMEGGPPPPAAGGGGGGGGADELSSLLAQLALMTTSRDQALAARDQAREDAAQAVQTARAEARRTTQALRVANSRGSAREEQREARHRRGPSALEGGGANPFVYHVVASNAATYSVSVSTHRVYLDGDGRIGRCLWKDVPENLTIRVEDPAMNEGSRPAFELFVGGITSEASDRFNTDTVLISERDVRLAAVAPGGGGRSVYHIVPTSWRKLPETHAWLAELSLTPTRDSGALGGGHVNLELGVRPLHAETTTRFNGMSSGSDVQVKFETENPLVGAVSASVRALTHGLKAHKDRIKDGDRTVVGYNTDSVYKAMRDRAVAGSSSAAITVDASP
jgi:Spy/CpxP family protein refolding chaperone